MNYFNGSHSIEVKELDTLLNMSQDTANLLAIGPQEDFMNKLDNVNRQLRLNQIEEINVTKLWNWRPGSYDKIKELINNRSKREFLQKNCNNFFRINSSNQVCQIILNKFIKKKGLNE